MHIRSVSPVFSSDGEVFRWGDVVEHARLTGDWARLERQAALGIALEADADEDDAELEQVVDTAGEEFRYERDLITADEMEAWLEARDLTAGDWMGFLLRRELRTRAGDMAVIIDTNDAEAATEREEVMRIDLLCSGQDQQLISQFAQEVAAAMAVRGPGSIPAEPVTDRVAFIREAARSFRAGVTTPEALAREISAHKMEWLRLQCRRIAFTGEAEAREAALCMREDGLSLDEVARDAHVAPRESSFFIEELDAETQPGFVGAQAGDVIGPLRREDRFVVYQVAARIPPAVTDDDVRQRAESKVIARALASEVNRRIHWHEAHPA